MTLQNHLLSTRADAPQTTPNASARDRETTPVVPPHRLHGGLTPRAGGSILAAHAPVAELVDAQG